MSWRTSGLEPTAVCSLCISESVFVLYDDNRNEKTQTANHKCVTVHFANKQTVFDWLEFKLWNIAKYFLIV